MTTRTKTSLATKPRASDPLLDVPDVMAELKVGRFQVYQLIKRGQLRSLKVGRYRRVRQSWLEEFIAAQEQQ